MVWKVVAFLIRTSKVMYTHFISFSFQELIERSESSPTSKIDIVLPDELTDFLSTVDALQYDGNHGVNLYVMCVQAIFTSLGET